MTGYLIRRLLLIPFTLLCILLVNFTIIGFAPGDPSTVSTAAMSGDGTRAADQANESGRDDPYLLFREHYGLTLPVLLNWRWAHSEKWVREKLTELKQSEDRDLRLAISDASRFLMPHLHALIDDAELGALAVRFFVRGGTRMGFVGSTLTPAQRVENELRYPGEIKVNVIRENRVIEYAR